MFKWADEVEPLTSFKVADALMINDGRGMFRPVFLEPAFFGDGDASTTIASSRGVALDDMDNDGDIDCIVLNSDAAACYLENQLSAGNHWLQIELIGTRFNRDGIGATVAVECGGLTQMAEVPDSKGLSFWRAR